MSHNVHLVAIVLSVLAPGARPAQAATSHVASQDPARAVEKMRGISMQIMGTAPSDGRIRPEQQRQADIIMELHSLGDAAVEALARALSDPDVQMRRNAALVLIDLGGGHSPAAKPRLNTLAAMPALIAATRDPDSGVRAWAAHALAEIGPRAAPAVPVLVKLLRDPEEGPRNDACIALADIGPLAAEALPALREALNDPSPDVRRFAQRAIEKIQTK